VDFPILDLLDEQACYAFLVDALHPQGLRCPGCRGSRYATHRSRRDPVLGYHCAGCGRVFNVWTGTLLQGTQRTPAQIVLVVRGLAQGTSTARPARELGCSRRHLLDLRHRLRHRAQARLPRGPLPDGGVEADEVFQSAGEKKLHMVRRGGEFTGRRGSCRPQPTLPNRG
jgi:transposase-like protein